MTGELIESGEDLWQTIYFESIPGANYPYLENLKAMAKKYNMDILFGRAYRRAETGQVLSTYTHINDEGQVQAIYEKQVAETIEEAQYLTQGEKLAVTCLDGLEIGLVLGYNETVQTIINRYEEEGVDLIIGGVGPLRHPCSGNTFEELDSEVPIVFCNYNICRGKRVYQGVSLAVTESNTLRFCPIDSEVIILDYCEACEKFEVVNRVNVNQVLDMINLQC